MKNILLLFAMILLNVKVINGQTYVSGGIFSNTTWLTSGNPYIVTGNVVVMTGSTLTLQPGVIIRFDNGTNMEVRGDLQAIGTVSDSIEFTSSSGSPTVGVWGGISFWNDLTLNYVKIKYATTALTNTNIKDVHINHSNISFNSTGLTYLGSSSFNQTETIDNTLFEENGTALSYVSEANHIANCIFRNNNIGIGYVFNTLITGCSFFGHTTKAIDGFGADYVGNLIENNNVGLRIKLFNSQYEIKNNTIINNQIGVQVRGDPGSTPNTYFYNNTICNNVIYNAEISGNVSVYLQNNCWCTTDSVVIANSIYDAYDNLAVGLIFFSPFQTNCSTSIPETAKFEQMIFYPNPLYSNDLLRVNNVLNDATIDVINIFGKVIQTVQHISGQTLSINHEKLNSGVYMLQVSQDGNIISQSKILILK